MDVYELKHKFVVLATKYCSDTNKINSFWTEIEEAYSGKGRYYHNLDHLSAMFQYLEPYKASVQKVDRLHFSIFYHDIVYSALRKDNEAKSAQIAVQRMHDLGVPAVDCKAVELQIVATQTHKGTEDSDLNLLLDIDLAVLGQPWEDYATYARNVRKEYSIYPKLIYGPGRKKALKHLLAQPVLYQTPVFVDRFEQQARQNMREEFTWW